MSVFANLFQVYAYGDMVRITFTDCIEGKEGAIQANVVMRTADAEALAIALGVAKQRNSK